MARLKMSKYARRTSLNARNTRVLPIIALIAVFLVLCFVISLVIGLILGGRAEKVKEKTRFDFLAEPYYSGDKIVRTVDAYAYSLGADVSPYVSRGVTDLSVCLRRADGSLNYTSSIGLLNGFCPVAEDRSLIEELDYVHERGGRVCAYFYVTSFETEDTVMRELYQSYEIALVREASECGADDILLICPEVTDENVAELERYVSRMASAAGNAVLGVLVSPELLSLTEEDVYHAARLREACDYIALDLRALPSDAGSVPENETGGASGDEVYEMKIEKSRLETVLEEMEYYIRAYSMRVVLSKGNASLYDSLKEHGVVNLQIVEE